MPCAPATQANGFFDINMQVVFCSSAGVSHVCEIQLHSAAAVAYKIASLSHDVYCFWRDYFRGAETALRARLAELAEIVDPTFLDALEEQAGTNAANANTSDEPPGTTIAAATDDVAEQRRVAEDLVRSVCRSSNSTQLEGLAETFRAHVQQPQLALLLLHRLLAVRVAKHGPRHVNVAAAHTSIGRVLRQRGKWDAALASYAASRAVLAEVEGPRSDNVAAVLVSTGAVQTDQQDYPGALASYEEALGIYAEVHGTTHEHVGTVHNNIALVLDKQGDLDAALERYGQALAIRVAALGPEHAAVAKAHQNMAIVFKKQGKLDAARAGYEKALSIQVRALGPDHTDNANTHYNLGLLAKKEGDFAAARDSFTEAHRIRLAALGPGHASTKLAAKLLGRCQGK